ncbi:MAG: HAD family hydrolase [Caldilineaceae bacterium]
MIEQGQAEPNPEPLTPEEKEAFLARVRAEGRTLTSEEMYAIFGPPQEKVENFRKAAEVVEEMEPAWLDERQIESLKQDFFPELENDKTGQWKDSERLVRGVLFDFDDTLAYLSRPLDELMTEGAKAAEAYMRSTGMELQEEFWKNIIEARRFAQEKSEEEKEEHLADDAMSFLLQFFGYPASRMDPNVLKWAVDLFYAPEMSAWKLIPGVLETLRTLQNEGYRLALLTNYNCDRVFQRTVDYLGLRPYFDVCISSSTVEVRKPDQKFFQLVLDRWEALPYEVVVVGDSLLHDIQGGIELGALTVQTKFGSNPQIEHENAQLATQVTPDAVIEQMEQLVDLVRQWT